MERDLIDKIAPKGFRKEARNLLGYATIDVQVGLIHSFYIRKKRKGLLVEYLLITNEFILVFQHVVSLSTYYFSLLK